MLKEKINQHTINSIENGLRNVQKKMLLCYSVVYQYMSNLRAEFGQLLTFSVAALWKTT